MIHRCIWYTREAKLSCFSKTTVVDSRFFYCLPHWGPRKLAVSYKYACSAFFLLKTTFANGNQCICTLYYIPWLLYSQFLVNFKWEPSECIKHVMSSASKLGQCNTSLLVNKFTILFIKSDIDEFGTEQKPVPCPT